MGCAEEESGNVRNKRLSNRFADSTIWLRIHRIRSAGHAGADKQCLLVQEKVLFDKEVHSARRGDQNLKEGFSEAGVLG